MIEMKFERVIIFVIVFVIAFSLRVENVFAKVEKKDYGESTSECRAAVDSIEGYEVERYAIDLDITSNNNYIISIDPNMLSQQLKNMQSSIKFKIVKLEFLDSVTNYNGSYAIKYISSNHIISPGHSVTIKRPSTSDADVMGYGTTTITLEPVGFNDPELEDKCTKKKVTTEVKSDGKTTTTKITIEKRWAQLGNIMIQSEDGGRVYSTSERIPSDIVLDTTPLNISDINCTTTSDSFEKAFCHERNLATKVSNPKSVAAFKCNAKTSSNKSINDSNYYENVGRYLYEKEEDFSTTYTYNYECGKQTSTASCTVKCQEVVTVEYGPPVAVKAGLCFEYKVRATSRVHCHAKTAGIGPPDTYVGYCTPTPVCYKGKATVNDLIENLEDENNQGGPSEEFDNCVSQCDGGKYTDKCVDKCYKEVYTSAVSKTTGKEISYDDVLETDDYIEEIRNSTIRSNIGFRCDSNKKIYWYNGGNVLSSGAIADFKANTINRPWKRNKRDAYADPRWHLTMDWGHGTKWKRYRCYKNTGIPCVCSCSEKCKWLGCKDSYLNPSYATSKTINGKRVTYITGEGINDYRKNVKAYNDLKKKCLAAASCSTSTAEFTISAKANNKWIDFPAAANNGSDSINTKLDGQKQNSKNLMITLVGGCYNYESNDNPTDRNQDKWSQVEWTFPGSYINTKTGELSYNSKVGSKKYERKFCVPLNQKNVNLKWWRYYYTNELNRDLERARTEDSENYIGYSLNDPKNQEKCKCDWKITDISDSDIEDYNIKAIATNFGKYGWNLEADCFYAVGSLKPICPQCYGDEKNIRTVDLNDMFPAKDGTPLSSYESVGRDPGFNWTNYANNTKTAYTVNKQKVFNYNSKPNEYLKWVQKKAYSIYSDDYLDYQVNLTRDIIKTLKEDTAADGFKYNNFTEASDKSLTKSVINYKSALLRETLKEYTITPTNNSLECNNMKNHKDGCEDFKG